MSGKPCRQGRRGLLSSDTLEVCTSCARDCDCQVQLKLAVEVAQKAEATAAAAEREANSQHAGAIESAVIAVEADAEAAVRLAQVRVCLIP